MKSVEAVRLDLQYSRAALALLAALVAASVAVAFFTPLCVSARAAVVFAVLCAGLEAVQRVALLRGPRAVRGFVVQRDGAIEVESASGARTEGAIRPGCFVAPWLVIVRWRLPGKRRDSTIMVMPDMAPPDEYRRLRVLLRWS